MLAKLRIFVFILSVLGCIGVAGMWTYSSDRWVNLLTDAMPQAGGVSFCAGITNVHWGEVAEVEFRAIQDGLPLGNSAIEQHQLPTRHLVGESQRLSRLRLPSGPWFEWTAGTPRATSDADYRDEPYDSSLVLPTWYFLGLYLPGLLWGPFANGWVTRCRPREGHCRRCGYDLRATPQRCPECGTPAAAPPSAPSAQ